MMKRFTWRLQRVLDIKEKTEAIKRSELLQIGERLAEARTALLGQERILRDALRRIKQVTPKERLTQQALILKHAAVNDATIKRLNEHIDQLAQAHAAKAGEVIAVRQEREGLERLREKARTAFLAEQERTEQHQNDDRNSAAFRRRHSPQAVSASPPGS
jgi:flagellar biosynthesis chaperone FliJ